MPRLTAARPSSDRGAMLVQVAIMILMLMGFTVFVIDYGVVWVARAQAQNAADAGALSGALALAFDDPGDPVEDGVAWRAATQAAAANPVWGLAGVARPSWPFLPECSSDVRYLCARVDTYRNGEFGSARLPVFFGSVLGIGTQGVRATATARVMIANRTPCMRPWGVVDLWSEVHAPLGEYNRWVGPPLTPLVNPDVYVAPTNPKVDGAGTGYKALGNFGMELTLKIGNPDAAAEPITSGWALPLTLPGGRPYEDNIASCSSVPVSIGTSVPTTDVDPGVTRAGVEALMLLDPAAHWDAGRVAGSCAPGCASFSPRVVPLPVFNMDDFQFHRAGGITPGQAGPWTQCPGGGKCVTIVNILGFFVDRMQGGDIVGYLMMYPGLIDAGAPTVGDVASFLAAVRLIR